MQKSLVRIDFPSCSSSHPSVQLSSHLCCFSKLQANHDAALSAGLNLDFASIIRFAVNSNMHRKAMVYSMASLSVPSRYGFINAIVSDGENVESDVHWNLSQIINKFPFVTNHRQVSIKTDLMSCRMDKLLADCWLNAPQKVIKADIIAYASTFLLKSRDFVDRRLQTWLSKYSLQRTWPSHLALFRDFYKNSSCCDVERTMNRIARGGNIQRNQLSPNMR